MPRAQYRNSGDRADEQSMDEILASIRRIIDEEPLGAQCSTPASGAAHVLTAAAGDKLEPSVSIARVAEPVRREVSRGRFTPDDDLAVLLEPSGSTLLPGIVAEPIADTSLATAFVQKAEVVPSDRLHSNQIEDGGSAGTGELPSGEPVVIEVRAAIVAGEGATSADDLLSALAADLDSAVAAMAAVLDVPPALRSVPSISDVSASLSAPLADSPAVAIQDFTAGEAPLSVSPQEAAAAAVAAVAAVHAGVALSSLGGCDVSAVRVGVDVRDVEPTSQDSTEQADATSASPNAGASSDAIETVLVPREVPNSAPATSVENAVAPLAPSSFGSAAVPEQHSGSVTPLVLQAPSAFEDAIATMLRPLLRDWLDANLPRMVEKALKDELSDMGGLVVNPNSSAFSN
jgi:uncharacterized protein